MSNSPNPEDDRELNETYEMIRALPRIEPSTGFVSRLNAGLESQRVARQAVGSRWRLRFASALSAAAAFAIVGTVLWVILGTHTPGSVAWADIAEQVRQANTIRLDITEYEKGEVVSREVMYLRPPDLVRLEPLLPNGKPDPSQHIQVRRGNIVTHIHPVTKLYHVKPDETGAEYGAVFAILKLIGWPDEGTHSVQVKDHKYSLVPAGEKIRDGVRLTGFKLVAEGPPDADASRTVFLWTKPGDQRLRYVTSHDAQGNERWVGKVDLNPKVADDLFDAPGGGRDVTASFRSRLPKDLLEVYDSYERARERFTPYRAMIWRGRGGWPSIREVRDGNQWRTDGFNIVELARPDVHPFTKPDGDFEAAWERYGTMGQPLIEKSVMTYNGWLNVIGFNWGGGGPRVAAYQMARLGPMGYRAANRERFMELAWPQWMSDELYAPHGLQINEPPLQWQRLPDDPRYAGLIGIRGMRDRHFNFRFEYWLDPNRDYLCVHREEWETVQQAVVWDIREFGRTPDGRWYPTQIDYSGGKIVNDKPEIPNPVPDHQRYYIRIDVSKPINPSSFDWPDGVPPPNKLGIEVMMNSQVDQRLKREAAFNRLSHLLLLLREYVRKHDGQWPGDLSTMLKLKTLPDDYLVNPRIVGSSPGFIYLPPASAAGKTPRLVIYEAFKEWPGEIVVGYSDGGVELIGDMEVFGKRLRESKVK